MYEVRYIKKCRETLFWSWNVHLTAPYKASKIIFASWESWFSELQSTQRLWSLGRWLEKDDSSWELLLGTSKDRRDDMNADGWNGDGRLFFGDIQDKMIDGNASRENPS